MIGRAETGQPYIEDASEMSAFWAAIEAYTARVHTDLFQNVHGRDLQVCLLPHVEGFVHLASTSARVRVIMRRGGAFVTYEVESLGNGRALVEKYIAAGRTEQRKIGATLHYVTITSDEDGDHESPVSIRFADTSDNPYAVVPFNDTSVSEADAIISALGSWPEIDLGAIEASRLLSHMRTVGAALIGHAVNHYAQRFAVASRGNTPDPTEMLHELRRRSAYHLKALYSRPSGGG